MGFFAIQEASRDLGDRYGLWTVGFRAQRCGGTWGREFYTDDFDNLPSYSFLVHLIVMTFYTLSPKSKIVLSIYFPSSLDNPHKPV